MGDFDRPVNLLGDERPATIGLSAVGDADCAYSLQNKSYASEIQKSSPLGR